MNYKEMAKLVAGKNADLADVALAALKSWADTGMKSDFYKHELASCVQWAHMYRSLIRVGSARSQEEETSLHIKPANPVTSELMAKRMGPYVNQIRKAVFDRAEPFPSFDSGMKWLENVEKAAARELEERRKNIEAEPEERGGRGNARKPSGSPSERGMIEELARARMVDGAAEEYTPARYRADLLGLLFDHVRSLGRITGWSKTESFVHVLTGTVPVTPRFKHHVIRNRRLGTSRLRLDVYAHDLTFEELYGIYKETRSRLSMKGKKSLTDEDLELYKFVEDRLAPIKDAPRGSKGDRWRIIQGEWNSAHPGRYFETSRGLEMAHKRIAAKLGDPRARDRQDSG